MPGQSWAEQGKAQRQPHEYVRNGIAKLLTLFCPNTGELRAKGRYSWFEESCDSARKKVFERDDSREAA